MDFCLVCLEFNGDILARINANSLEWENYNIQRIIEKHLWWWHLKPRRDNNILDDKWVCRPCWQQLWSFHMFYVSVEKKHNSYYTRINEWIAATTSSKQEIPDEIDSNEAYRQCEILLAESPIPLTKRKRGRPRLQSEAPENITIEELSMVEVKDEDDSHDSHHSLDFADDIVEPLKSFLDNDDSISSGIKTPSDEVTAVGKQAEKRKISCKKNDDMVEDDDSKSSELKTLSESETRLVKRTKKRKISCKNIDVIADPSKILEDDDSKSSGIKTPSDEEETRLGKRSKKRKISCRKNAGGSNTNEKASSSAHLTRKYDDFIAANHELFCSLCHVPLTDFQTLITHFRDEHNTKAFAMCCGKKFYKRAVFVDHLYIHKDPEYFKCQHCDKVLSNRRCLKNHLEWHDETRKPKFNCAECGKDFFKRGSFEKHKLLHVPEDERRFQCSECHKKFASESLRTQHLKVTHLNKYAKICDICGKPFRERHSFQRHLAEHTGIPTDPIQCDLCGMKLTSTYGLNRHKRLRHTEENMQEQVCPYCSKVSPNIAAHRSHIQYSHTMQRKHGCHLCDKAFRRPKELKEHLSTHTGEALYTCPHCPRTFISNANMHKHRKNEHPKEWEEARLKRLGACTSTVGETDLNT